MDGPKNHAMCLLQTISDFPEGLFQILIWTVASEGPFGVRACSEQKRSLKRLCMLMKVLNLLAFYRTALPLKNHFWRLPASKHRELFSGGTEVMLEE